MALSYEHDTNCNDGIGLTRRGGLATKATRINVEYHAGHCYPRSFCPRASRLIHGRKAQTQPNATHPLF